MIPSRIGFVWLERPLRNDHEDLVQGFGWTHVSEMGDPTPALFGVTFAIVNEQGRRGVQTGHFGSWIMNDRPNLDLWEENWPLKFQAALFLFMEQRILMSYHERPDRASRRRMGESRPEAIIRVIKLRRLAHIQKGSKSNVEVEWSCQWITRGHWRQQWYPSLGRHQPKWIAAYVKGPEDKPLKAPRNNIFAVVR